MNIYCITVFLLGYAYSICSSSQVSDQVPNKVTPEPESSRVEQLKEIVAIVKHTIKNIKKSSWQNVLAYDLVISEMYGGPQHAGNFPDEKVTDEALLAEYAALDDERMKMEALGKQRYPKIILLQPTQEPLHVYQGTIIAKQVAGQISHDAEKRSIEEDL